MTDFLILLNIAIPSYLSLELVSERSPLSLLSWLWELSTIARSPLHCKSSISFAFTVGNAVCRTMQLTCRQTAVAATTEASILSTTTKSPNPNIQHHQHLAIIHHLLLLGARDLRPLGRDPNHIVIKMVERETWMVYGQDVFFTSTLIAFIVNAKNWIGVTIRQWTLLLLLPNIHL